MDMAQWAPTILLLGEGNFSFAVALVKQLNVQCNNGKPTHRIIATDCKDASSMDSLTLENISWLKNGGTEVFLDVDATRMDTHDSIRTLSGHQVSVVFNFPHVVTKKMHLGKNRRLLSNFFVSLNKLALNDRSQVMVSLAAGQSGLPLDEVKREYNDTWKVTKMAADGHYSLVNVHKFNGLLGYQASLFKNQIEKKFNTDNALTCVFESRPLTVDFDTLAIASNFKEPVLYPPKYVHDVSVSFIDQNVPAQDFIDFVFQLMPDIVTSVKQFDVYQDNEGHLYKGFRITYEAKHGALSKTVSNKIQNVLRDMIAVRFDNKLAVH